MENMRPVYKEDRKSTDFFAFFESVSDCVAQFVYSREVSHFLCFFRTDPHTFLLSWIDRVI